MEVAGAIAGAAALGMLVAVAELVSRYRDDPWTAIASLPASLYVAVNAMAAVSAFLLIRAFGWEFGASSNTLLITQILVAGFGAAALFRTSFFNVTAGDQVIGIGPSAVLNVILTAADRAVDRRSARLRSEATSASMQGVPFEHGANALALYCFAAMQNASRDEVQAVEDRIALLRDVKNDGIPDQVKSYVFGLTLATVVGDKVLSDSAARLKSLIGDAETEGEAHTATAPELATARSRLLEVLTERGPMRTVTLQRELGLDLSAFTAVLQNLIDDRVVSLQGDGDGETVVA